jgi:hypothetical protein
MMADITDILDAQRAADQPGETFRALDAALANKPGHILFTILIHHPALRQNERFYTNMPEAYPVGGRKPVTDSAWMEQVIVAGQPYIGRTRDDIREVFFDYELIWSLGCESVLNMPVRFAGQTYGTINLLHTAHHYSEAHLHHVRLLAQLALPAMMLISRT